MATRDVDPERVGAQVRELSGGKPIGIKFCVGSRTDVLAMCKAMWEERIAPDFIIVDGSAGTDATSIAARSTATTPGARSAARASSSTT